jgi:hypothetical protein
MGLSAAHRASIDKIVVSSARGPATPPRTCVQAPGPLDVLDINDVTRFHLPDEQRQGGVTDVPAATGQLIGRPVSLQMSKIMSLSEHHTVHQLMGDGATVTTAFMLPPVIARRAPATPDDGAGEGTIVTLDGAAPDSLVAVVVATTAAHGDVFNRAHSRGAIVAPEPIPTSIGESYRSVESPHPSRTQTTWSSSRMVSFQDIREVLKVRQQIN